MYRQLNQNPPIKGVRGLLIVIGIVAAVWLDSLLAQLLTALVSELVASIFFWGIGVLIALFALRRYVMGYSYSLSSSLLRISHAYGRHERLIEDIYLSGVVLSGSPEVVAKRYPDARVRRAVLPRNPAPPFAIAYRDDGRIAVFHLQPDARIREALEAAGRGRK